MLAQGEKPSTVAQIWKLIMGADPKDRDEDIWRDPDENSSEETKELEEKEVQPFIKREA